MIERLKTKWGITSTRRIWTILIVFSLTGCGILILKGYFFQWLNVSENTSLWIRIPLVIVLYQVLLVLIGAVFGEFQFFWSKEKRLLRWLAKPFLS